MNSFLSKTLSAGLLVGTLDITAAFINYYIKTGKGPKNVLSYIASAVFGKEAFSNKIMMQLWGLLFHFCIAYIFTVFFFLIYKKLVAVLGGKIVVAIFYGAFIWSVMQFIVLPLSRARVLALNFTGAITAILILVFCIAVPLSLIAGHYYRRQHNH